MGAEGSLNAAAPKAEPNGRRRLRQMGAAPLEGEGNPAEGGYFASHIINEDFQYLEWGGKGPQLKIG